jgi:hypothetical protein
MPRKVRIDALGCGTYICYNVVVRGLEARDILFSDMEREDIVKRLAEIVPKTRTVI